MRTLLMNGSVYSPADPHATAIAFDDGVVTWIGDDTGAASYANGADEVIDLQGRLVTPAFVDSHVHSGMTGFKLLGIDLGAPATLADALDAVRDHAAKHDGLVLGFGWDETRWPEHRVPTGAELENAAPGRLIYLSRVDGHSAVISPALAAKVPDLAAQPGWTEDGRAERTAHHVVRDAIAKMIPDHQRRAALQASLEAAARLGIGSIHELGAPHICPADDMLVIKELADAMGLHVVTYWGELGAFDKARELGVAGLAGDLVADGAVGSRTAAMSAPYADAGHTCGHAYLTAEEVAEHVIGCTSNGLQAGFHCIGDAGVGAVVEGLAKASDKVGAVELVAARHRLEHVEMIDAAGIDVLSRNGVVASVQPMFDALWGGAEGMYAERLGDRWSGMNPYASMARAGVALAFGSDSPVTALDPWGGVRAAAWHQTPSERITVRAAFAAHTRGGWRAAGIDDAGVLAPGTAATYAIWDLSTDLVVQTPDERVAAWSTDVRAGVPVLPDLQPDSELPTCLRTVVAGRVVYESEGWRT
ncbi:amidohydrolase [Kribbella deserti]|uniref:Amidohydrolase n=1 Tax=Kribbella deserti TaxID=1926257 RepID=A0ABV6QLN9_9ACTN